MHIYVKTQKKGENKMEKNNREESLEWKKALDILDSDDKPWIYISDKCPLSLDQVDEKMEYFMDSGMFKYFMNPESPSEVKELIEQGHLHVERSFSESRFHFESHTVNVVNAKCGCYLMESEKHYLQHAQVGKGKDIEMEGHQEQNQVQVQTGKDDIEMEM